MPTPNQNESEKEFVSRCIPIVLQEGTTDDPVQAAAICHSKFKEAGKDAVVGNYTKVKKAVSQYLESDKKNYGQIIDKYIDEIFNASIREVERELQLQANSLYDFDKRNAAKEILKSNMKVITYELFDTIDKEVTLFLSNAELNNIPFTTSQFRQEIQNIFNAKKARLMSQVITETTRTANSGFEWGYKESGIVTHKQVVAILDDKTTNICRQLNGEIREIGEPFSTGDYQPPFHINCRSRIQPITLNPK